MAEQARRIDVLDTGPRFTAAQVEALNARFADVPTLAMLRAVLREGLAGDVAAVSSFGAESAVLLHLIATIDRSVPVLFLDTGKHFPETLDYRDEVMGRLGMTNLVNLTNAAVTLTFTPKTNMNGSLSITLIANDGAASSTNSFLLTVSAVNDAPSFTLSTNVVSIAEDAGASCRP